MASSLVTHHSSPSLVITGGDPCGIGPEVILKALAAPRPHGVRLLVIGDWAVFERTARALHLRWPRAVSFLDCPHRGTFRPGRTSAAAGAASLDYIEEAIRQCRQGKAQGIVTAPVTKWAVGLARSAFIGHTEYLAAAFRAKAVVMLFASDRLRVALLTRHVALRRVPSQVRAGTLCQTAAIVAEGLRRQFGIRHPRLAICGLNPHAGEHGLFGDEERRIVQPALRALAKRGIRVAGPFAADGFFAQAHDYDAVLCWYHDQGLIPFKLLARDRGCQVTLGLPIVRTSPDHGSALDLAGQGRAHPGSMQYAIRLASTLVRRAHAI